MPADMMPTYLHDASLYGTTRCNGSIIWSDLSNRLKVHTIHWFILLCVPIYDSNSSYAPDKSPPQKAYHRGNGTTESFPKPYIYATKRNQPSHSKTYPLKAWRTIEIILSRGAWTTVLVVAAPMYLWYSTAWVQWCCHANLANFALKPQHRCIYVSAGDPKISTVVQIADFEPRVNRGPVISWEILQYQSHVGFELAAAHLMWHCGVPIQNMCRDRG